MLQQIDNGAASKKLDLGLDLIDPRSSFIHIFYSRVVYTVSQKNTLFLATVLQQRVIFCGTPCIVQNYTIFTVVISINCDYQRSDVL